MTVQPPPARPLYQPVIPDLLQSLLDTAPMPRVPLELRPSLETAPRPMVRPSVVPTTTDEASSLIQSEEGLASVDTEEVAPVSQIRTTPWWAWALMGLMALQILLLVYIILRIELILATVR
jgi:hypothetical protein